LCRASRVVGTSKTNGIALLNSHFFVEGKVKKKKGNDAKTGDMFRRTIVNTASGIMLLPRRHAEVNSIQSMNINLRVL
jgi:hypothetical protein